MYIHTNNHFAFLHFCELFPIVFNSQEYIHIRVSFLNCLFVLTSRYFFSQLSYFVATSFDDDFNKICNISIFINQQFLTYLDIKLIIIFYIIR